MAKDKTPSKARMAAGLLLVVAAAACVYGYQVANARPMLDEATVVRRAYLSPWRNETYEERFYSVDWPAFARWTWRGAFLITGWHWEEFDDEHYEFQPETPLFPANIRLFDTEDREVAPRGPVYVLRTTAAVFMTGGCVLVFFLGALVCRSTAAGVAMAVPFLVHPGVVRWAIAYPGTDAIILFWMLAFLLLWVVLHRSGAAVRPGGALLMAVVAGLAAATKINGGLLTVAFAMYLLVYGEKKTNWWLIPAFCAAAFAMFVAINPVFWKPGAGGVIEGLRDVFARRAEVMEVQRKYLNITARSEYFKERWYLLAAAVPALAWAAPKVRQGDWLAPAAIWSVTIALGSYAMLNRYDIRLALPIDMAVMVTPLLALLAAGAARIGPRGETAVSRDGGTAS